MENTGLPVQVALFGPNSLKVMEPVGLLPKARVAVSKTWSPAKAWADDAWLDSLGAAKAIAGSCPARMTTKLINQREEDAAALAFYSRERSHVVVFDRWAPTLTGPGPSWAFVDAPPSPTEMRVRRIPSDSGLNQRSALIAHTCAKMNRQPTPFWGPAAGEPSVDDRPSWPVAATTTPW